MRITNKMVVDSALNDLQRASRSLVDYQKQLATNQRINKPSDDPAGISKMLSLKEALVDNERYLQNITEGTQWLVLTEAAVTDAADVLSEVRNLTVGALNDSMNAQNRDLISVRLADYIDQLVEVGLTKDGSGRYIFGGTNTLTTPYTITDEIVDETFNSAFDTAVELDYTELKTGTVVVTDVGGGVTYTEGTDYTVDYENGTITVLSTGAMADSTNYEIDYQTTRPSKVIVSSSGIDGEIKRQIDDSVEFTVNTNGDEVFNTRIDTFDTLRKLKNALVRNDRDALDAGLAEVDIALEQVFETETLIGSRMDRLSMAELRREDETLGMQSILSQVADTDVAEVLVQLQTKQTAYQTALSTAASLFQMSLMDFM